MDEQLQQHLGQVARVARERLGLTQVELAEKLHLVPEVYGRIERGMLIPSILTVWRLSLALGVSSDVLLGVLPFQGEATLGSAFPEGSPSPELRRIVHRLRTWPPERLRVLDKMLSVLGSVFRA
ncbi:multiprotein-bridging factor 1 family protein [Archangium sp.]|uniref:helix-turn-helix domain-containing protein n=1 Tax=Archangium sp. TaxID=1872627 RepID=UPI00389ABCC6